MDTGAFGVLDHRFLSRSIGMVNPKPALILSESDTVKTALEILQKEKVGSIAVTDATGKLTGIFTERDVVLKVCLNAINIDATPLNEIMTKNPQTASTTTTMAFALNMMSQGGYRHIPITDDEGFPIAILSVKDIVDHIVSSLTKDLKSMGKK